MEYENVKKILRSLPVDQRAKLIQEELQSTGLTVVLGGSSNTTTEISVQIHTAGDIQMDQILQAIADKIRSDSSNNSSTSDK